MKYKLTKNTKEVNDITLFQIQALKDFGDVKKGDLGGWIQKEKNLCQKDNSWVYGNAKVFGNAKVYGDAKVYGNAEVSGDVNVVCEKKDIFDDFDVLSDDIEEVVIKGVRYKKVTESKTTWKKIS
jgi:hypothetical protein